jgi:hypothetical protein
MKSGSGIAELTDVAALQEIGRQRDRSRFVRLVKRILPVSRQARVVAAVLPPAMWFPFATAVTRCQGKMIRLLRSDGAPAEILLLDRWLHELTRHGAYPVPWRVHGRDVLDRYTKAGPLLYVTLHVALADMTLRALAELGYPSPCPVASEGVERYPVVGTELSLRALPATPFVLTRMRTLLLRGESVSCMVDRDHLSGSYSTHPMRLAARLRVPVIFCWGEIAPDGVVDVFFRTAPRLYSETEEAMAENLGFFQELRDRILSRHGKETLQKPLEMPRVPRSAPQAEPDSRIA